ncbi:MAG: exodeoxyribonuclease III [Thiohalocapsa sp.]
MPKLVSFNTNGIRSRPHQLDALKTRHDPDVIGIQESKVADDAFPIGMIEDMGYVPSFHGQKGHYGVALLSKEPPRTLVKGFPTDEIDAQRRAITGVFGLPDGQELTVINGYFPQGECRDHPTKFPGKRRFYADLALYLRQQFRPDQPLVLMGDMNVAPSDADVGIGADNAKRWLKSGKCCFLPEERDWLKTITDWGLFDAYRVLHPHVDDRFSWFDYRSRGFEREPKRGLRIDFILVTAPVRERLRDAGIDYDIRGLEKPSDHCPVWIDIE